MRASHGSQYYCVTCLHAPSHRSLPRRWLDASSAAEAGGAPPADAATIAARGSGSSQLPRPEPHFSRFRAALGLGPHDVFQGGIGSVLNRFLQFVPSGTDALSREAFAAAVHATFFTDVGKPAPSPDLLDALFAAFDADADGTIDVSELLAGLSLLLGRDEGDKIAAAFLLYDEDGERVHAWPRRTPTQPAMIAIRHRCSFLVPTQATATSHGMRWCGT